MKDYTQNYPSIPPSLSSLVLTFGRKVGYQQLGAGVDFLSMGQSDGGMQEGTK